VVLLLVFCVLEFHQVIDLHVCVQLDDVLILILILIVAVLILELDFLIWILMLLLLDVLEDSWILSLILIFVVSDNVNVICVSVVSLNVVVEAFHMFDLNKQLGWVIQVIEQVVYHTIVVHVLEVHHVHDQSSRLQILEPFFFDWLV
jgi:hypothetical protein